MYIHSEQHFKMSQNCMKIHYLFSVSLSSSSSLLLYYCLYYLYIVMDPQATLFRPITLITTAEH